MANATFHKATWLHKLPSTESDVRGVARRLAEAEFDLVIPCVKQTSGIVDYQSRIANVRKEFRTWDPLEVLCDEAGRLGIDVHAWCCVFPEGPDSALLNQHPEWTAQPGSECEVWETQFRWACPQRQEVQDYEAAVYQELLDRYPLAGVHLDYIRSSRGLCFCEHCQTSYRHATGKDLLDLNIFTWNNPDAHDMDAWIRWRCEPIDRFVRRIRHAANAAKKELSAAVFHYYPGGLEDIAQDWEAWVREGLLDHIFPMNYSLSTMITAKWTRNNVATLAGAAAECRHWEGILRHRAMTTPRFIEHVEAVLEAGVEGITVFEYPYLTDRDLAALKKLAS